MLVFRDVREVKADALLRRLGRLPDIVLGSPPCQDASVANHRGRGLDGERTGLFWETVRIIRECRPVWFALENVAGLRHRGIERLCLRLETASYSVELLEIGADCVGAPHRRRRIFVLGARNDAAYTDGMAEPLSREEFDGWSAPPRTRATDVSHRDGERRAPFRVAQHAGLEGPRGDESVGSGLDWGELGALLDAWRHWNPHVHPLRPGVVDAWLAMPHRERRRWISALGDSVMPAITGPICHVMRSLCGGATAIDLFAGAVGGWSWGAREAGIDVVAIAESDPWRVERYLDLNGHGSVRPAGGAEPGFAA